MVGSSRKQKRGDFVKTVVIVQARMGSTRLPNKVLLDIEGEPTLWRVINRLSYTKTVDEIIIATTESPSDDAIENFAKENGIKYFRGSENDVLDRYYQCAKNHQADTIVRITADCPLIDPRVVDKIVGFFKEHQDIYDYVSNVIPPTFPDGLDTEVFSFSALEKAWKEAKYTSEREHVTAYIYKNPNKFKLYNITNDIDYSALRWTLDTENDLIFIREVYKMLGKDNEIFYMEDVIQLLNKNPELKNINSDNTRNEGYIKSLAEDRVVKL